MRKKFALAVSAVAVAAAVGPVGSASAACINVGPLCVMPCSIVTGVYNAVDTALGGVLPPFAPNCIQ